MSAINVLVQSDSVHMVCDGLSYIDGVPFEVNLNKAHLLRGMRAALSATGPAELGRFIAEHVEREFTSFDDLVANGSERIKQLFKHYVSTYRRGDAVSVLSLIGWHEKAGRPAAYGIDMETKGSKADRVNANNPHPDGFGVVSDLTETRVSAMPCPTLEIAKAAGYDLIATDDDAKEPATDLLHLLEVQRRMLIDGVSYVGGHAMMTSIDANSVTQRVVHVWPEDKPGSRIEPELIDWPSWRASHGIGRRIETSPPAGLTRKERRAWEAKRRRAA